ncbi:hypothetical protein AAG570_000258 [Ranatra chinensis]|uniref:Uncharacterized protein n=1 Tax=Ranatra chinensis TaxID=642074 RepID=A0ABD0YWJ2_9HEMI
MAAIPSKHPMGFKSALRPLLQFSQIIGILPVEEINYRNTKTIRFRWKSRKVFYTCFLITVSGTMVLLSAVRVLRSGISLGTTGDFIFYSCTTAVMVLFLRLATKWPDLMSQWGFTEETMMADHQSDISRTIHLVSVVVLILSLGLFADRIFTSERRSLLVDRPNVDTGVELYGPDDHNYIIGP